jgi:hypothetical protein
MADLAAGVGGPKIQEWAIPGRIPANRPSRAGRPAPARIGRRIADVIANTAGAAYAAITTPRRRRMPTERHYHRRESFVEDAAMSREMFRL